MSACPNCGTEMSFYKENKYEQGSCIHDFEVEGFLLQAILKQRTQEIAHATTIAEAILELKSFVDSLKQKGIYK